MLLDSIIFSFLSRKRNFIKKCKKWAMAHKKENVNIIVYSLNSLFLTSAIMIKKMIKNSKICVIVPDLPFFMSNYHWPLSLFKRFDISRIEKLRTCVDCYAVYSEFIAKKMNLSRNSYIVTEGFIDKNKINIVKKRSLNDKLICMYAGDLNPMYSINTLIRAFDSIQLNAELRLYGDEKMISQYRLNDNVKYIGCLSPDEVYEEMKKCDLLINPRPSSLKLTKYSFPSKTFEYLASGTPCLMCKLPAIPSEYFEYINFFSGESVEEYRKSIEDLFKGDREELLNKANKGALFLLENKTTDIQVKKIITLINSV